jgi:hypothetical protein
MNLLGKVLLWSFLCRVLATPARTQQTGLAGIAMKPRNVFNPSNAAFGFTRRSAT